MEQDPKRPLKLSNKCDQLSLTQTSGEEDLLAFPTCRCQRERESKNTVDFENRKPLDIIKSSAYRTEDQNVKCFGIGVELETE